jgi:hypothetical protein
MSQVKIASILKTLEEIEHVKVSKTAGGGSIKVEHKRHHGLEFMFRWASDHFIGYFKDSAGNQSQAVISLYTPLQATSFATAYSLLCELRANQRA